MVKINTDLRSADGGTIHMPPFCEGQEGWGNLSIPNVHGVDTAQAYPVGTRFAEGDRVFRYVKLGTEDGVYLGHGNYGLKTLSVYKELASSLAIAVSGSTVLEITCTATKNQYAGGYVGLSDPATGLQASHRIVSNTVTVGTTAFFTLARAIGAAVGTTCCAVLCENPYASVNRGSQGGVMLAAVVGMQVPHNPAAGNWIWVQTWGTCAMIPSSGSFEGGHQYQRMAYFLGDGAIQIPPDIASEDVLASTVAAACMQPAGWLMPQNDSGEDQDYAVLSLTIAP